MPEKKRTATGAASAFMGLIGLSAIAGLLVTATVTPALAVSGATASSAITAFENMPELLEIDELIEPTEIYATNSEGEDELLARFYDQNRVPLTYDEVPEVMFDAILSSEDRRYYEHGGVDLIGTTRALIGNISGENVTGGSSISQQYVKNVLMQRCVREEPAGVDENGENAFDKCWAEATTADGMDGIQRKLQEMRYAISLEQNYPKNDILLGYLNIAAFGGTTYGVGAAAQRYFDIDAQDLNLNQAATIAGMVQAPTRYRIDIPTSETNGEANGYAVTKERRDSVLGRMLADGKITREQYDKTVAEPITPKIRDSDQGCTIAGGAGYFCDYVKSIILEDSAFGETPDDRARLLQLGGLRIYTTLDADLQRTAEEAMALAPQSMPDMYYGSAATQLEVGTGRVLSMVQNKTYDPSGADESITSTTSAINYNVPKNFNGSNFGFPAGSTYKVFSDINWLEQGHSINEVLNGRVGEKQVLLTDDGRTAPVNAANSGPGHVGNFQNNPGYVGSPYRFTADSLNSGFFAMGERISVQSTNAVASKLGVTVNGDVDPAEMEPLPYQLLGSEGVAPVEMAAAYATIASGGMYCAPRAIDRATDSSGNEIPIPDEPCERRISENVAATTAYTLQAVMNGTGIGARVGDGIPVMGKTGIHESAQFWMDGASTRVATVAWSGQIQSYDGQGTYRDLTQYYANGWQLGQLRNAMFREMQGAANAKFGGEAFPQPDTNLTRQVYADVPNVIGMGVDEATGALQGAGFQAVVGSPVNNSAEAGTIAEQSPAGRAPAGSVVTISPSNGEGATVPSGLVGMTARQAGEALRAAGFQRDPSVTCESGSGPSNDSRVLAVEPGTGSAVNRNDAVTIRVECGDDDDED